MLFRSGQRRIAAYILDSYATAAFMTASRLGAAASVSESTVVRFAAELGYDGYPAMQRALQEVVRGRLTSLQRMEVSSDRLLGRDIVAAVLQTDIEKLRMTVGEVDRRAFGEAVEALLRGRHVYILGVRSSSFLAGYLHF